MFVYFILHSIFIYVLIPILPLPLLSGNVFEKNTPGNLYLFPLCAISRQAVETRLYNPQFCVDVRSSERTMITL